MEKNKLDALNRALSKISDLEAGHHSNNPVCVNMQGVSDDAPDGLADEISLLIGRPIIVNWRKVESIKRVNNTGDITDAPRKYEEDYGVAAYYEDAARRGARTGD